MSDRLYHIHFACRFWQRDCCTLLTNNNPGMETKHCNAAVFDNILHQSYEYMNEDRTSYCCNLSAPNNKNRNILWRQKDEWEHIASKMHQNNTSRPVCQTIHRRASLLKKNFNRCPRCSILCLHVQSQSLRKSLLMCTSWIYAAFDNPSLNRLYCSCSNTL